MRLVVNGEAREGAPNDLAELWLMQAAALNVQGPQGFAIAVNGTLVRQVDWAAMRLHENDRIEIIRAVQGG